MRATIVSLIAMTFCPGIAAQAAPHTTTNPRAWSGVFTNHAYATYPFGRTGGLIQYWRRGADLTVPQIITATGGRATQTLIAPAFMLNGVELTMSNTPVTFQGFSSTYANNFGPQSTIVFTRKAVNLVALNGNNSPNVPVAWLMHDVPFLFQGPNFLVQVDLGTAVGSVGINRPADGIPSTLVHHIQSAPSCGGTLTASGTGTSYALTLQGASVHRGCQRRDGVELPDQLHLGHHQHRHRARADRAPGDQQRRGLGHDERDAQQARRRRDG
jgi:hypothetical protein